MSRLQQYLTTAQKWQNPKCLSTEQQNVVAHTTEHSPARHGGPHEFKRGYTGNQPRQFNEMCYGAPGGGRGWGMTARCHSMDGVLSSEDNSSFLTATNLTHEVCTPHRGMSLKSYETCTGMVHDTP